MDRGFGGGEGGGEKVESVEIFFGYFLIDALCRGVDWCRFEGGRGGGKKRTAGALACAEKQAAGLENATQDSRSIRLVAIALVEEG